MNQFCSAVSSRISHVVVAGLLLAAMVSAAFISDSELQKAAGDTITTFAAFYATLACWRAVKSCKELNEFRRVWQFIGGAMLTWCAGNVIFSIYEIVFNEAPFPTEADIFFLLYYPAIAMGLLRIRKMRQTKAARSTALLEMGIAFVAGLLGFGRLIISPLLSRDNSTPLLTTVLATAYPAFDLAVVWVLFGLVVRPNALRDNRVLYLLTGGALSMTIADCFFGYENLVGTWNSGGYLDMIFTLSFCFYGLSAIRMVRMAPMIAALPRFSERSADAESIDQSSNPFARYIMLGIMTLSLLSVAWLGANAITPAFGFLFGGSVLIVTLALFRMLVAIRENRQLFLQYHEISKGLKAKAAELEDANSRLQVEFLIRGEMQREQREMESRMLKMQKLESLEVLAGGIAHDFNNLLTAMLGNIGIAKLELPENHRAMQYLDEAERTTLRAADLTQQMLAYSGKGGLCIAAVDLNEIAEEMTGLLQASISKKVNLELALEAGLPKVEADPTQIGQVLMNLIINASEALEGRCGHIKVRTSVINANEAFLAKSVHPEELKPGRYVTFEVQDDGAGISPETLGRIFEPFFTTKFTGRGLGLAATMGIVRGHRGMIQVESSPGSGSRFLVGFPAVGVVEEAPEVPAPEGWRGDQTILVVEDEAFVRNVTIRLLQSHGFRTITAENGEEAVGIFRKQNKEIDAVLLDLTMPVMSGEEAFVEFSRINANVPVIVTSGYAERAVGELFKGEIQPLGFVQKPFNAQRLTSALQLALN